MQKQDILLEVKDLKMHFPILEGLVFKKQVGAIRAVDGISFDVWPGHPKEREVRALLATMRKQIIPLWDEITEYNRSHASSDPYRVTFYCGQHLVDEEDDA